MRESAAEGGVCDMLQCYFCIATSNEHVAYTLIEVVICKTFIFLILTCFYAAVMC